MKQEMYDVSPQYKHNTIFLLSRVYSWAVFSYILYLSPQSILVYKGNNKITELRTI